MARLRSTLTIVLLSLPAGLLSGALQEPQGAIALAIAPHSSPNEGMPLPKSPEDSRKGIQVRPGGT
ncbi:MAG: hypothetical protein L0215_10215 [Gemmataceae bacterium]|nr:hypothetical protein [Gemmataceae bacterium]